MDRAQPARWRWTPVLAYMALIFGLSSISHPPPLPGHSDKALHALLYFGLGALVVRALAGGWNRRVALFMAFAAVVFSCLYGMSDEYHQSFVPNRQADVFDLVADTVGAAIAALVCFVWSRFSRSTHSARPV